MYIYSWKALICKKLYTTSWKKKSLAKMLWGKMGIEQITSVCGEENTAAKKLKLSVCVPNQIHFPPSYEATFRVVWRY